LVLQQNRLQWYGHELQKEDNDWVKKCRDYEVAKKYTKENLEIVEKDYQACNAMDHSKWRKQIRDD